MANHYICANGKCLNKESKDNESLKWYKIHYPMESKFYLRFCSPKCIISFLKEWNE